MAISKDDIFRVANEIDALGQSPTLAAVRKALGGGSFTTISEAMNEWKLKKSAKEMPLREPAPQAVLDQLTELGAELWSLALSLSNGRLDAQRQALDATRIAIEAERREATELADQVSAELEEVRQKAASLETQRASMQAAIEQLKSELASTMERAAAAEARAGEINHRADDLNAELLRVNAQNSELIKALTQKALANKPARSPGFRPADTQGVDKKPV